MAATLSGQIADPGGTIMQIVAHRRRAIRDQIVDREVRRVELIERARREAVATRPQTGAPVMPPERR
jgi:hypothetical protein